MNVWIDSDLAIGLGTPQEGYADVDDAFAILQLLLSPSIQVKAISTVFGNTDIASATQLAKDLCQQFAPETQIYQGASKKLSLDHVQHTDASSALADALRKERLNIMAIGPATNLATILLLEPDLAFQIDKVVLVAGRRSIRQHFKVGPTHDPPFPDLNFDLDPEAFRILLQHELEIVLLPFEISHKIWIDEEDLSRLSQLGKAGAWLAQHSQNWLQQWSAYGVSAFNPFDVLASGWLVDETGYQAIELPIEIEIGPDDTQKEIGIHAFKPYLLVSPTNRNDRKVTYVHTPPSDFKERLFQDLTQ